MTLEVITIYGKNHIRHINMNLIPSLQLQNTDRQLRLNLLNYAEPKSHFATEQGDRLAIRDISINLEHVNGYGFGAAVNAAFRYISPSGPVLILNPDTRLHQDCIAAMLSAAEDASFGIVEARQWPNEHPKEYHCKTHLTPWASGACMLVDAALFAELQGFDPVYFMYCEDVDLSWRVWLAGRSVRYAPNALCLHYTGSLFYRHDRYYLEHFYSARNFIALSYKFFGSNGESRAMQLLANELFPATFKQEILNSYFAIKHDLNKITHQHRMIKITGFNQYHNMQSN